MDTAPIFRLVAIAVIAVLATGLAACSAEPAPPPGPVRSAATTLPPPSGVAACATQVEEWRQDLALCHAALRDAGYSGREAAVRCTSDDVRRLLRLFKGPVLPPGYAELVAHLATLRPEVGIR